MTHYLPNQAMGRAERAVHQTGQTGLTRRVAMILQSVPAGVLAEYFAVDRWRTAESQKPPPPSNRQPLSSQTCFSAAKFVSSHPRP